MATTYNLVRRAAEPRLARLEPGAPCTIETTCTIAAHLYRGTYYPGIRPHVDASTRATLHLEPEALRIELAAEEPHLAEVLAALEAKPAADFFAREYVSINVVDPRDRVLQAAVKPDGTCRLLRDGEPLEPPGAWAEVRRRAGGWAATLRLPRRLLGLARATPARRPVPFDLVRHRAAMADLTAWCPIPNQQPFNELYRCPVFCFGLLGGAETTWESVFPEAPALGTVAYEGPARVPVGSFTTLDLTYTVGPHGLARGGALRFNLANEVIECNRNAPLKRHLPEKDWTRLQWENPAAPGYVEAQASRRGAKLALAVEDVFSVTVRPTTKGLQPGDTIALRLGGGSGPGVRAQLLAQGEYPIKLYVDPLGKGVLHPLEPFPTLDVVGGKAHRLLVHCPPTPEPGETFRLVVAAVDGYGNLAGEYAGEVDLHAPVALHGLPRRCRLRPGDRGAREFHARVKEKAVFTVTAVDRADPALQGESNLVVTDGSFGPEKIFFGDIHTHSQLSDGRLPLDQKARELRHHRGCDFWANADHGHDQTPERLALWRRVLERENEPGDFATLPAYEWTGSMGEGMPLVRTYIGHRNVYFRRPVAALPDGVASTSDTVPELDAALRRLGVPYLIITHFHCGDPTFEPAYDAGAEVSGWAGSFVRELSGTRHDCGGHSPLQSALAHRRPLAVVAGTDHGGEAYYTGLPAELTAVRAPALTREAVFDAMAERQTYATSGQKVLLDITLNGKRPGRRTRPSRAKRRRLAVTVGSALPVIRIAVMRNGKTWKTFPGFDFGVQRYTCADTDAEPAEGYYYLRVETAQGHQSWSSPLFFDRT